MGCGRTARVLVLALGCLGASAARAQLQGHISMAKEMYVAGEPIYVHFEVTNTSQDAVQFVASDPYNEGCGDYVIEVSRGAALAHSSCKAAAREECNASSQILPSGETNRQNILVNYAHDVSKAGSYEIHAVRVMKYGPLGAEFNDPAGKREFKVEARFRIEVQKEDREALKEIYKVYVTNLESNDSEIQREAERAIVSGAPPWLEETIEGMVRRSSSREFALLGLKNLNTARSRERLAGILQNTSEYTEENEAAVAYLAELGDKKYFPVLLELAKKQEADQGREYVVAAAELGGDDALPYLKELVGSKDANARANGVVGLGVTGSRAAVGVLVDVLKSASGELGKLVVESLVELTHRTGEDAGKWAAWWEASGASAKVYGRRECGEVVGLE